ncbi:hypothetical protein Avbf_17931 [Armadillidium vulgare]|nr:hypothetical protein Avbf_17931 [Armadillidium vulgare]
MIFLSHINSINFVFRINGSYEKVLTVPDTVTEWITIILSSPDNKFEILEDSGNMTGSGMRNACVPLQDKIVLSIRIRAKDVGDVNISVKAVVQANAVSNCGSGIVQQETYVA